MKISPTTLAILSLCVGGHVLAAAAEMTKQDILRVIQIPTDTSVGLEDGGDGGCWGEFLQRDTNETEGQGTIASEDYASSYSARVVLIFGNGTDDMRVRNVVLPKSAMRANPPRAILSKLTEGAKATLLNETTKVSLSDLSKGGKKIRKKSTNSYKNPPEREMRQPASQLKEGRIPMKQSREELLSIGSVLSEQPKMPVSSVSGSCTRFSKMSSKIHRTGLWESSDETLKELVYKVPEGIKKTRKSTKSLNTAYKVPEGPKKFSKMSGKKSKIGSQDECCQDAGILDGETQQPIHLPIEGRVPAEKSWAELSSFEMLPYEPPKESASKLPRGPKKVSKMSGKFHRTELQENSVQQTS